MSDAGLIDAYRAAERALFARHGVHAMESWIRVDGRMVRVQHVGPATGPATLFVHGGGGCSTFFAPLLGKLPERRAVLVDRPGCGLSEDAPLAGVDFRRHAVTLLEDTLDALGLESVDVVANSMGGLWSIWLALDRPARVRSLSLLGTPALTGGTGVPLPMRLLGRPGVGALMMKLEPPSRKQTNTLWARMGHDPAALSDEVHNVMEALERLPSYEKAWRGLLSRITTWSGPAKDCVLSDEELARVSCPTSLVFGTHETFGTREHGERIARALKISLTIAGRGHLPWLDDPEACARALVPPAMVQRAA